MKSKSKECKIVLVDNLRPTVNVNAKVFTVGEKKMDKKYNRAKDKRDMKKFIEEER